MDGEDLSKYCRDGDWIGPGNIVMPAHLHPSVLALTAPRRPTQDGVARRLAEEQAGRLRYCHEARAWFVWDGALWRRDATGIALHRVREVARDMATNAEGEVYYPAGRRIFLEGVERLARCDPALAVTADAWDSDGMLLGTPQGAVDLATGLAVEADPARNVSRGTGPAPADAADCPTWQRFLCEACGGDAETVRFLHRFLGYALTGSTQEQAMLFCQGPGGTGKSLFLATVLHVLGDYAAAAPLALLAADPARHAAGWMHLRGTRLVAVAECERGRHWDARRLDLLTGGDPLIVGGRPVAPTCKLLVTGHHPPRLDDVDRAMRRRLCIVPFRHRPAHPDHDLPARLRAEAPGILRWMIEGCGAWRREGLGRCPAVEAATADFVEADDILGQFLAERCDLAPGRTTPAGDLYRAWCAWTAEMGETEGSQRGFAEALAARGFFRARTDSLRLYRGLALKPGLTHDAG